MQARYVVIGAEPAQPAKPGSRAVPIMIMVGCVAAVAIIVRDETKASRA